MLLAVPIFCQNYAQIILNLCSFFQIMPLVLKIVPFAKSAKKPRSCCNTFLVSPAPLLLYFALGNGV